MKYKLGNPKAIAILSHNKTIAATSVPKEDPYMDLTFHIEEKAINLHIKLDDEGIVIDVYDESHGNFDPDTVFTTWLEYNDFGVLA